MKREQIILTASQLFMNQGYGNVSMDLVARAAKVSKATLYSHFNAKNELFKQVLADYINKNNIKRPVIDLVAKNETELINKLNQFVLKACVYFSQDEVIKLYRLIISEIKEFPELFDIIFGEAALRMTEQLSNYLQSFYSTKPKEEVYFLAMQILDLIRGVSLWPNLVNNPIKNKLLSNHKLAQAELLKAVSKLIINF